MAFFPGKGDSIHSKEPKMPKKRAFDKGEGGGPDPPFWPFLGPGMVGRQTLANLRLVTDSGNAHPHPQAGFINRLDIPYKAFT